MKQGVTGSAAAGLTIVSRDAREHGADVRPLSLSLYARLFRYTRACAAKRNVLFVTVLLRAGQSAVIPWMMASTINGPIRNGDWLGLLRWLTALALFTLFTQVTLHFRQRLAFELGESVVHDLRRDLFRHMMEMPMSYFNRTRPGLLINRFTSDVEAVRNGVQNVVFASLVNLGGMLVAAGFMVYYDRGLFLVVLATAPILWGLNRIFRTRLSQAHRAVQESFSRVTATVSESVRGVRVTQSFNRWARNAQMFHDLVFDHSWFNIRVTQTESLYLPLMDLNGQFFLAALLILGGYRVLYGVGTTTIGDLVQFFFLAGTFFNPIHSLANHYNQALTAMASAERIFRFLDTPPDWTEPPADGRSPVTEGQVELDGVSFAYVPDRPVLRNLSFSVKPGASVALVGPTGSGKTTLLHLIAKFYIPTAGVLRIDGRDIVTLNGGDLRRSYGIVLQQNFLFSGTVLDNIRMGRPEATESEVREAARRLDCLDVFDALPNGLQTRVGEQGAGISLGERQLICFARAMLVNPRILLLDEATSAVDALTEARLQAALERLLVGRTSFVIAHRLSTVRNADRILVLDRGRLVEDGTHRDLVRRDGLYARLYREFMLAQSEETIRKKNRRAGDSVSPQ